MRLPLFTRRSDPAHIEVPHEGACFRVIVKRRPTARRFTLRVSHATGDVVLTLPPRGDLGAAKRFALAHGGWIAARLARRDPPVAFAAGAVLPLRGVAHRVVAGEGARGATRAGRDAAGERVIIVHGAPEHVERRLRDFLKAEALKDLTAAVDRHTAALGLPARRIAVRDTKARWGSCSSRGHLNFSWRLVLAPPLVLDYLAAHEVAHLKEMNHSARFWAVTRQLAPHTDEAERWLKRHGSELHRYGAALAE